MEISAERIKEEIKKEKIKKERIKNICNAVSDEWSGAEWRTNKCKIFFREIIFNQKRNVVELVWLYILTTFQNDYNTKYYEIQIFS